MTQAAAKVTKLNRVERNAWTKQKIFEAATGALKSKELIDAYAAVGGIAGGGTSAELVAFLRGESEKWAAVIKAANIKLE